MNKNILIIILTLTLNACGQNENNFPAKIENLKTDNLNRIKGTKIFANFPNDYQYIKELARYQKNDNLYIQVLESVTSNYNNSKPNFKREVLEAKGSKIDVYENININNLEGIYSEGPSKIEGETKLILIFGDDNFIAMVTGVCKTSDLIGKNELKNILKSIYYDKSFQLDPMELANFEFDLTITDFKYSMSASNNFVFTQNGPSDNQNPSANSIMFQVLPKTTDEKAELYAYEMLSRYEQNGFKLEVKTITKNMLENYPAYLLETKIELNGKKGIMYQALLIGKTSNLFITTFAYSDLENYITKYKKTVESVKIK